jgi:hypothetical protein
MEHTCISVGVAAMAEQVYFVLRTANGEVRLHSEDNAHDAYACGSQRFSLVDPSDYRWEKAKEFRLADEQEVQSFILRGTTEWYNSSAKSPNWNGLEEDDFSFEKVTVTRASVAFSFQKPVSLSDFVKNADWRVMRQAEFNRLNMPEGTNINDLRTVVVWRYEDNKDFGPLSGQFEKTADGLLALLADKLIKGKNGWRDAVFKLIDIVQPDEDYYYVYLQHAADLA